jgi:hypothetical protein
MTAWFPDAPLARSHDWYERRSMGAEGQSVQADESYYGNSTRERLPQGHSHKASVVALVEPKGRVRAFHLKSAPSKTVGDVGDAPVAVEIVK